MRDNRIAEATRGYDGGECQAVIDTWSSDAPPG